MTRPDDELRELMALDAVGALDAAEREELELAIANRPDLWGERDDLLSAAATLADAVSEAPPPALRPSVLDAIASTPQRPRIPVEPPLAPVVSIDHARRRRWLAVGSVAAAVIALVVGFLVVSPFGGSERNDEVAAVLDDPSAEIIQMPATPEGDLTGSISIVYSAREGAAVLRGEDLAAPSAGRVYQLWAIRGGAPEPVDVTFRPDDGAAEVYLPGIDPASAEAWAVSEEPDGGSTTPTEPILALTA